MHIHQWISSSWMYHIVDSLTLNSHQQNYIRLNEASLTHVFFCKSQPSCTDNCSTIPGGYFTQWNHQQKAQKDKKVSLNRLQKRPLFTWWEVKQEDKLWLVQSQLGTCALGGSNFLLLSMSANYNKTVDFEHNSQHRICKWFWGSTVLWSSCGWVLFISCSAEEHTPVIYPHGPVRPQEKIPKTK